MIQGHLCHEMDDECYISRDHLCHNDCCVIGRAQMGVLAVINKYIATDDNETLKNVRNEIEQVFKAP